MLLRRIAPALGRSCSYSRILFHPASVRSVFIQPFSSASSPAPTKSSPKIAPQQTTVDATFEEWSAILSSPDTTIAPVSSDSVSSSASSAAADRKSFFVGYLAHSGHLQSLIDEIDAQENRHLGYEAVIVQMHGNLVLVRFDFTQPPSVQPIEEAPSEPTSPNSESAPADGPSRMNYITPSFIHPLFASSVWFDPQVLSFQSNKNAADQLRKALRVRASPAPQTTSSPLFNTISPSAFASLPLDSRTKFCVYPHLEGLSRKGILIESLLPNSMKALRENIQFPLALPATIPQQPNNNQSSDKSQPAVVSPLERPLPPLAAFTLLSPNTILFSLHTSSPFPSGEVSFVWDRTGPPSRAYLKVWEALTRFQLELARTMPLRDAIRKWRELQPQSGQVVLDLGSSPGGWTWALATSCGVSEVVSIDRAPLDPRIAKLPAVKHFIASGFSVEPYQPLISQQSADRNTNTALASNNQEDTSLVEVGRKVDVGDKPRRQFDWLFSDIICYPERALTLIEKWLHADAIECGMVVTIKMQQNQQDSTSDGSSTNAATGTNQPTKGPAQMYHLSAQQRVLAKLRSIPNSQLVHLCENKTEVTFLWLRV